MSLKSTTPSFVGRTVEDRIQPSAMKTAPPLILSVTSMPDVVFRLPNASNKPVTKGCESGRLYVCEVLGRSTKSTEVVTPPTTVIVVVLVALSSPLAYTFRR
eukprot:714395-Prymnesium_polylepis.1